MSSGYPSSSYAARSAAAYNNQNTTINRNPAQRRIGGQYNAAPRVGTFPSMQGNQNYQQDLSADQQNRLLSESTRRIQEQAYYMRRAMDEDDLPTVLERATFMLSELGSGSNSSSTSSNNNYMNSNASLGSVKLSPKNYYELQMKAMDEMPNLEEFFLSLDKIEEAPSSPARVPNDSNTGYFANIVNIPDAKNESSAETEQPSNEIIPSEPSPLVQLYETAQYSQRVLPRLYLQICAGTALLRSRSNKKISDDSPKISVMKDLMDHVKCVQNPVRGLFLRNYVLQIFKYPMDETLEDLYQHLLQNFVEMNQLWVRIQHLPSSRGNNVKSDKKERRKREKERNEMRLLVGTNLVRLSQLEGITPAIYKEHILPPILDQIVSCKDPLAQAYLMDCIIQVFPDEYHIATLSIFLDVLPKLKEKVNVRTIMQGIMERLSNYFTSSEEAVDSLKTFEALSLCVQTISSTRTTAAQDQENTKKAKPNHSEIIHLQTYLFKFSLQHFPDLFLHLDEILNSCADTLNIFCATAPMDDTAMSDLEKLLMIPLNQLSLKVLELNSFGTLLEFLPWQKRKNVGKGLIQAVIADGRGLRSVEQMVSLLRIITPLLKPDQMKSDNESMYQDDIDNELNWVAKLVHLYDNEDTDVMFEMFNITSKYFSQAEKSRIENTLSSLVFATFKLLKQVYGEEFAQELESVVSANANSTQTAEAAKESKEENTGELEAAVNDMNVSEDGEENKKDTDNDANPEDGEISKETTENEAATEMNGSEGGETGPETTDKNDSSNDIKDIETEQTETEFVDVLEAKKVSTEGSLFEDSESKTENLPSAPLLFNKSANCRKIFLFLQQVISPITPVNPGLAYQLFLNSATMASSFALPCVPVDFNSISYEFLIQAFNVYANDITESKAQMNAMTQMVGTLLSCRSFSHAEFGALVTKAAQYSARMLKKPDQCTMVTLCSHLFYTGDDNDPNAYRHPQRVLECLQRALKIADACTTASASNVYLFIDILDHYVFYFEREAPLITDRFVSGLIALTNEHLAGSTDQDALVHSQQIVKYVQAKKLSDKKFAKIIC